MGCGQAKHAVHSPVLGELASTRVSQTTALPEQENTPTETIPLDATAVAAELAEAGAPAAPVVPESSCNFLISALLPCPRGGAQKPACVRGIHNAANLRCT